MEAIIFGSVVGGIILMMLSFWILSLRVIVPTDKVHIVQRAKSTISYGAGREAGNVYYNFPSWMPLLGITVRELPISNFDLDLKGYEAYDKDRVPFIVDVKAFFRIEDTNMAAAKVKSFDELIKHLAGIVQGSVRSILAKSNLSAIMEERAIYGDKFTEAVKDNLKEWGVVNVKAIELMDIKDAPGNNSIQNIMAKKQSEIEKDSRVTVAKNKQLAEEQEIASSQAVSIKRAKMKEETGKANAQADKVIGIETEKSAQAIKEEAKITAEKEMEIKKVQSIKSAEINKESEIIRYNQEKQMKVIEAEAEVESANKKAEAIKLLKEAEAKGIQDVGSAEAEATKQKELAKVTAQITLAEKVGANKEYQDYMIKIEEVKAKKEIGIEQAKNLGNADIKIIANSGDVSSGMSNIGELFSSKGGTKLAGMLEGLAQTEIGKNLVDKITKTKS